MQGLVAQLDADRRFGRGAVIPLVEQQVERAMHGGQTRREIFVGQVEAPPGRGEHLFCSHDSLLRRRRVRKKRCGDLVHAEPAQDVKDQRDLRLLREPRMTARKHHPEQVVTDRSAKVLVDQRHHGPLALEQAAVFRSKGARRPLAPKDVNRAAFGGVISQADGFSGTPRNGQTSSARQKAS